VEADAELIAEEDPFPDTDEEDPGANSASVTLLQVKALLVFEGDLVMVVLLLLVVVVTWIGVFPLVFEFAILDNDADKDEITGEEIAGGIDDVPSFLTMFEKEFEDIASIGEIGASIGR